MSPQIRSPQIWPFHHKPSGTWSYVVAVGSEAAIIDPVLDYDAAAGRIWHSAAQALLDRVRTQGLTVRWILETHAHADHLSAAQWLKPQLPQAQVAIGAGIADVQRRFADRFAFGADFAPDGSQFDRLFAHEDHFRLGGVEAHVLATPGHTSDGVSYLIGDALFIGDTLFMPDAGSARCDFPGGDAVTLYRSIRRLYALPESTRVFVCHDYGPGGREPRCETSIGEQKRANTHLRDDTAEADYVRVRRERDATLAVPQLLLPALQVNLRAGALPSPSANGVRYLRIPLDIDDSA